MVTTPVGELRAALVPGGHAPELFEVFAHPFTAGETVAQSALGALKVNGAQARAEVVDRLGNGDYLLRITTKERS
jgi:hypothetical protein